MPWAEFEEKEYETGASYELAQGGGFLMSPGQVLEKLVGYDAVAAPVARHVIWQLLQINRPTGVRLLPSLWAGVEPPADRLPLSPVSLIVQYKRPEYLRGARAAQWRLWKAPYYRFTREVAQHRALLRLDRSLSGDAVVRYAAPAFWTIGELEAAVITRTVLEQSGFVAPSGLGAHRVWTYVRPGVMGRPNPSGRRLPFQEVSEILSMLALIDDDQLPVRVEGIEPLKHHLARLADVARSRSPDLRRRVDDWMASVGRRGLLVSEEGIDSLADLVSVSSLMHEIGCWWGIADRTDPLVLIRG